MALLFDPDAFQSIPRHDTQRIMKKIDWLWLNREYVTHEPLNENLSGFCKRRVGKYRIIYSYTADTDDMTIHLVGQRNTIYRDVDRQYS